MFFLVLDLSCIKKVIHFTYYLNDSMSKDFLIHLKEEITFSKILIDLISISTLIPNLYNFQFSNSLIPFMLSKILIWIISLRLKVVLEVEY